MYRRLLRNAEGHARLVIYLRWPKFDYRVPIVWKRWETWTRPHRHALTVGILYSLAVTLLWGQGSSPPDYRRREQLFIDS